MEGDEWWFTQSRQNRLLAADVDSNLPPVSLTSPARSPATMMSFLRPPEMPISSRSMKPTPVYETPAMTSRSRCRILRARRLSLW
ncbi:hypothetical protein HanIR_Chr09g0392961 [Helianthus annuus]|nr:hypothetical protein HanIR_Chr09g0392961 [Helianthus annuus]